MESIGLKEIEERVRELAAAIEAPAWLLPTYGRSEDGARPNIEVDSSGRMHFVVVERGKEFERSIYVNLDELLYRIFRGVTLTLACDFEVKHRNPDHDSRRIMFARKVELLRLLSPQWAEREEKRHAEILKESPFHDSLSLNALSDRLEDAALLAKLRAQR